MLITRWFSERLCSPKVARDLVGAGCTGWKRYWCAGRLPDSACVGPPLGDGSTAHVHIRTGGAGDDFGSTRDSKHKIQTRHWLLIRKRPISTWDRHSFWDQHQREPDGAGTVPSAIALAPGALPVAASLPGPRGPRCPRPFLSHRPLVPAAQFLLSHSNLRSQNPFVR